MKHSSIRWQQSLTALLTKLRIKSATTRNRLTGGLFYVSYTHYYSIIELSKKGFFGSSFALLRPQFEAFIRGLWCMHIANENEIRNFALGEDPPAIGLQIEKLGELEKFGSGVLLNHKKLIWSDLCDFTHAGGKMAAWHVGENHIGAAFGKKQLKILCQVADAVSFSNAIAFAELCENDKVLEKLLASHKRIYKVNSP